ncbi:hypothetical protein [Candidatus Tisiphia endosymbiont of Micropterix aruncella]|uniref:hypothetical protein n=1 Tax=Candidatus Tisiphia endosymbiont of Micropterix aruncella TaxID=3066271 RepID=UPI003AA82D73
MKLSTWMSVNKIKPTVATRLFETTHTHIYRYLYEAAIPREKIMMKIFITTRGAVTPNDFYGATDEFLEQELLKELKQDDYRY